MWESSELGRIDWWDGLLWCRIRVLLFYLVYGWCIRELITRLFSLFCLLLIKVAPIYLLKWIFLPRFSERRRQYQRYISNLEIYFAPISLSFLSISVHLFPALCFSSCWSDNSRLISSDWDISSFASSDILNESLAGLTV